MYGFKEKLGVYLIVGYLFKSNPLDASIQVAQKSAHHRYQCCLRGIIGFLGTMIGIFSSENDLLVSLL